ncbi:MAG: hypothetical protein ABEN55_08065, partial [Bradymonadaceae bacterium]
SEEVDAAREELLEDIERYFESHRGDLQRRHWVQAIATLGLLESGSRELYRSEVLRALPSLRYRRGGDGEKPWDLSWHPDPTDVPDGVTDAGGFAALLTLAGIGDERRADSQPFLSIALAGLSVMQASNSLRELIGEMERGEVDAFSSIDTILSASTVPLVLPEAIRAVHGLLGGD